MLAIALGVLIAMLAGASDLRPEPGLPVDRSWSGSPVWDDGMAEVARYDSHRKVYGLDRTYETIVITVKEEFDKSRAVKADPPYEGRGLTTVLKMNVISRIDTESYPYFYMASLFVRRADPRQIVKMAVSSQEWCGTTFKELVTWDGPPRLEVHSYFDGQADERFPMELGDGDLLEEQLLLLVRAADLRPEQEYHIRLYDSQIVNSAKKPALHPMVARLAGEDSLATPAGAFSTRRLELRPVSDSAQGPTPAIPSMVFWVQKGGDRALVKFESSDGRSLVLASIARRDYWSPK